MKVFPKNILLLLGLALLISGCDSPLSAEDKHSQKTADGYQAVILTNENFLPALIKSIDEAQDEILMSIFSFKAGVHKNSYPDRIVNHLDKAVRRGVKVTVVLETTRGGADDLTLQNKKAGDLLQSKGINVFYDSPRKTTHTKLTVIDQRLIFLGSHNFTQSALKYNNEISVVLNSPDLAESVRRYILKIIRDGQ